MHSCRAHLVGFLLVATAGCREQAFDPSFFKQHATQTQLVERVFGNAENLQLVRTAPIVTACRLSHEAAGTRSLSPLDFKAGPFIQLTEIQAQQSRSVLTDPRYYFFDDSIAKACGDPVYGVRICFKEGEREIDVNLCFMCDDLAVTADDKEVGWAEFGRARPDLVRICKELFPKDAEIQRLSQTR